MRINGLDQTNFSESGLELSPEDWERYLRKASDHGLVEAYHEASRLQDAESEKFSSFLAIAEIVLFGRGIEY